MMALQIVSNDIVGAGTAVTIATSGENLFLMEGVLLGSTTSAGIDLLASDDVSLRIDGTIAAVEAVISGAGLGNLRLLVGETGVLFSTISFSSSFGVSLRGGSCDLLNYGEISSPEAISVFMRNGNNEVQNFGSISGVTGLQLFGGGSNDVVYNAGLISGSGSFDDSREPFEGTGIYVQSSSATIINTVSGRIITTAPGGPAITAGLSAGGLSLQNSGEIRSLLGTGIDLSLVLAVQAAISINNQGLIMGQVQSLIGSANGDTLVNGGVMQGNVVLGDGTDLYDGRGGKVIGTVSGGLGNDVFRGNALAVDDFNGGEGSGDTLDFRGGPAVVVALDGSEENAGAALGDSYLSIEHVYGSTLGDVIVGSSVINSLRGEGGADAMDAGAGSDLLRGGAGIDTLTGGLGNDKFIFEAMREIGDVITDFGTVAGDDDQILIRAAAFGGRMVAGAVAATLFISRADNLAQDANDRFVFRTTDRSLWFDADGNGAGVAVMLADLQAGVTLTAADLLLT